MSNLIDRDELYKALARWDWQDLYLPVHLKELVDDLPVVRHSYEDGVRKGYEDAVRHYAKMALRQWNPVSEGAPKKDGRYQVTRHDYVTNTEFIDTLWYEKNLWWDRHSTGDYAVTAWMPLPEPYKGGDAE